MSKPALLRTHRVVQGTLLLFSISLTSYFSKFPHSYELSSLALALALIWMFRWVSDPVICALRAAALSEPTQESYFEDGSMDKSKRKPFPIVTSQEASVELSVVIPAYNEEKRLGRMVDEAVEYLDERQRKDSTFKWEIVVVDDGSTDGTFKKALSYSAAHGTDKVRVLKLARNNGKGGAIRKGMLRTRGKYLLMADADGATRFDQVENLERSLKKLVAVDEEGRGGGLVYGSRAHLMGKPGMRRTGIRGFVSGVFGAINSFFVPGGIRDTQCGFKLISRPAAKLIFPRQWFFGWSFDCEWLFLARKRFNLPVAEVAVDWVDIEGSKLSVADASLEMLRDIFLMWVFYSVLGGRAA